MKSVALRNWLVVSALGLAGVVTLVFVSPSATPWFPKCPLHWLTGLYCPVCGTSRAFYDLVHGRVVSALNHNVVTVTLIPVLAWLWVSEGLRAVGRSGLPMWRWRPLYAWVLIGVTLVFAVLRNVPVFPFTVLAP